MRILTRSLSVVALVALLGPRWLGAQEKSSENFRWYIGGQVGVFTFVTPTQTRTSVFSVGGNVLVKAKRTGLLISVDEGITAACLSKINGTCQQTSSYLDTTAANGVRQVIFHDTRQWSFVLTAFPVGNQVQPYIGAGFALVQTVKEYPQGSFTSPGNQDSVQTQAQKRGSYGAGTALLGVQGRLSWVSLFAQVQVSTTPGNDKLLAGGPPILFSGGVRFRLGSSREGITGGGY